MNMNGLDVRRKQIDALKGRDMPANVVGKGVVKNKEPEVAPALGCMFLLLSGIPDSGFTCR